jgi:hypothetical protein
MNDKFNNTNKMKKEKFKSIASIILLLIGFGLVLWGGIKYNRYPGMHELRKAALHTVRPQYYIGFALLVTALVIDWKKFKSKPK